MKKVLFILCLALLIATPAMADNSSLVPQGPDPAKMGITVPSDLAAMAAGEEAGPPPKDAFVIIPQYFYSHYDSLNSNTGLKSGSGHSNGAGFTAIATKDINKYLALSFMYQFVYMKQEGGGFLPNAVADTGVTAHSTQDVTAHGFGLIADIDTQGYGLFNLSLIQGFDEFGGNITTHAPDGTPLGTTSCENFSDRVTSLMAWYLYPWKFDANWTLTPYAGWRSVYVDLKNIDGIEDNDDHAWAHFVSGGAKIGYDQDFNPNGFFGCDLRAGFNWRVSHDDIPGFAIRALAPGVAEPAYNGNFDPIVATFGVGAHYVWPGSVVLFGGYDGFMGADTFISTFTIGASIPF